MHPPATPDTPPAPETPAGARAPLFVLLAALLLFFLRFGYDYGLSDQDEFLPYLFHRLDPEVLAQDWFVQGQAAAFSVRGYFVSMLYAPARVMPAWLAVLGVFAGAWLLIAGAVFALAHAFTRSRLAAAATVVAVLVLTPQWTLGGNDLVHSMLVPSMVGWALGLWAFVFFLRRKPARAALLLGIATWMQALVGIHLAALLGMLMVWRLMLREEPIRPLLRFSATYVLAALPALAPLVYQQFASAAPSPAEPSLFYVLAQFRAPHHLLFYSFPSRSLIRFGILMAAGGVSAAVLLPRRAIDHRDVWARTMALVGGLCLVAFVCTELIPVPFVVQLQLFKTTVLAKLLLVIMICGGADWWLPEKLTRPFERLMDFNRWGLGAISLIWAVVLGSIVLEVGPLRAKIGPLAHEGTSLDQVETWARTQTTPEAVFAAPPSWSGFRSRAQRALVVNFKAFPFRDSLNGEWFERLIAMAPIDLPDRGSPSLQDSLDAAFLRQPPDALRRLAGRYAFDYVVRDRILAPTPPAFEPVFTAGAWIVYRIASTDRPAE